MKEKMITRTITSTVAHVLCANTETRTIDEVDIVIPGDITELNDNLKMKRASKYAPVGSAVVSILSLALNEQLYGIPESVFLAHAVPVER